MINTAIYCHEQWRRKMISLGRARTPSVCILDKEAWLRVRDVLRSYARPLTLYFSCEGRNMTHRDVARVEEPGNRCAKGKLSLL